MGKPKCGKGCALEGDTGAVSLTLPGLIDACNSFAFFGGISIFVPAISETREYPCGSNESRVSGGPT